MQTDSPRRQDPELAGLERVLKRRGSLKIWFDPVTTREATPTGKHGRKRGDSDAAIRTCLTMKAYSEGRSGK